MIKLKFLGASVAIFLLFSGSAYSREFADIYTDCGLGAMIAPKNDAVAAVTNVTWDLGTTAITSNASSADTCSGGKEKTAAYIFKSYAVLENDIAKGKGEHLNALYNMMGCTSASHQQLTASIRSDFSKIVNKSDYSDNTRYQKSESLYNTVTSNISKSCAVI